MSTYIFIPCLQWIRLIMQFWLTAAVTLLLAGACLVNGLDAVLNDTCGAEEISQVACMIKKLDEKLDSIIELVQGKLSFRHGKNPETVLDWFFFYVRKCQFH